MASARSRKVRAALRRAVFVVHLWIGLSIGLLFVVISATGSAIVFKRELDARLRPEIGHVAAAPGSSPLPLHELRARVLKDHPEAKPTDAGLFIYQPWEDGAITTYVGGKSYAIDPYTGRTLAMLGGAPSLPAWAKDLHTDLLAGDPGKGLNGWGAVGAAVLLLSGLWLWWPATRKQIRLRLTVRRKVSFRRTTYDLHNVLGFYSLLLLFIVTVTGIGLCFNKPVNRFVRKQFVAPKRARPAPIVPSGTPRPAGELLAIARREVPNAHLITVTVPVAPRQSFRAMLQRDTAGFFPYVSLQIDPYTGRVIERKDDADDGLAGKIMRQIAVLHFGIWGGLTVKILYVALGLVPLGLYATGVLLWINRLRSQRRLKSRRADLASCGAEAPSPSSLASSSPEPGTGELR